VWTSKQTVQIVEHVGLLASQVKSVTLESASFHVLPPKLFAVGFVSICKPIARTVEHVVRPASQVKSVLQASALCPVPPLRPISAARFVLTCKQTITTAGSAEQSVPVAKVVSLLHVFVQRVEKTAMGYVETFSLIRATVVHAEMRVQKAKFVTQGNVSCLVLLHKTRVPVRV
jgi:hypothetical protein